MLCHRKGWTPIRGQKATYLCVELGTEKSSNSKESSEAFPRISWTNWTFLFTNWSFFIIVKISHRKVPRRSPKTWEDKFLGIPFLIPIDRRSFTTYPEIGDRPPKKALSNPLEGAIEPLTRVLSKPLKRFYRTPFCGLSTALFWFLRSNVGDSPAGQREIAKQFKLCLRWIQEGFKGGFLQKHQNPIRVPFPVDLVRILGVCPAVTLTFGL